MKKGLIIILLIIIIAAVAGVFIINNYKFSNDRAQMDKNGRYLTIINDTNQIINEVRVTVGEGTEIEDMTRVNPDEKSFSIKIPKEYSEYDIFCVTLIDNYDVEYTKEVTNVMKNGRTEVKIGKENLVKESEKFSDKVDRFFNGD